MNKTKQDINLRYLWKPNKKKWLLALFLGLIALFSTVALLALSGWFITAAAAAGLTALSLAYTFDFLRPAAVIRAFAIARTAGRYGERLASHNAVFSLLRDLRIQLFNRISILPSENKIISSEVMHRLTSDIDLLDNWPLKFLLPWLWALIMQSLFLLWVYLIAPSLFITCFHFLILVGFLLPLIANKIGIKFAKNDTLSSEKRRNLLLQPLSIMTSLLMWGKWSDYENLFLQEDKNYNKRQLIQQRIGSFFSWAQQFLIALLICLLIMKSDQLIINGELSVPMLLAFILALFGLTEILIPLSTQFMSLGLSISARDRLNSYNNIKSESTSIPESYFDCPVDNYSLEVKNLYAKRTGALKGIEDINFKIAVSECILIVGKSGIGKSTLLDALASELKPTSGSILLNNKPLTSYKSSSLVGYLSQQIDIFDLTLAENLLLGNKAASEQELLDVLKKVRLDDWAKRQPDGLNTLLGEYGSAISGGEARRIALARILLKPRKIIILDEPFAGLDATNRNHLMLQLLKDHKNSILIIVSHQIDPSWNIRKLTL